MNKGLNFLSQFQEDGQAAEEMSTPESVFSQVNFET